jgi:hypothetical protein
MTLSTLIVAAIVAGAPDAESPVTFSRDVAPVFQRSCQNCHRPGEAAPMSLLTYEDARPWARSIRKKVERREMPPWNADPAYGAWKNDHRLSDEDMKTILSWVDAGSPEGDPKDLPPPKTFVDGWVIGKPDVVFTLPREFQVQAKGTVKYQYFRVPTNFTEDKWIQAAEARPGNRAVVHHIILRRGARKARGFTGERTSSSTSADGAGEEPGSPPGTAKKVKAGANLDLSNALHAGRQAGDGPLDGGLIWKEPVVSSAVAAAMNQRFKIPAGASAHEVKSHITLKDDSTIYTFMPHMHVRGKDFRVDINYPDGRQAIALSVPRWDFNWQHTYYAKEAIKLPKGTRIDCTAHFDNSVENKANPDPTKDVRWGDQTWEEIMIGFVPRATRKTPRPTVPAPGRDKKPDGGKTQAF